MAHGPVSQQILRNGPFIPHLARHSLLLALLLVVFGLAVWDLWHAGHLLRLILWVHQLLRLLLVFRVLLLLRLLLRLAVALLLALLRGVGCLSISLAADKDRSTGTGGWSDGRYVYLGCREYSALDGIKVLLYAQNIMPKNVTCCSMIACTG